MRPIQTFIAAHVYSVQSKNGAHKVICDVYSI